MKAATYHNTLYAAPYASDGGLLYYRNDLVSTAPTTWDQLISDCQGKTTSGTITGPKPACYAGQFAKYEGLTVNAAEAINAAGGAIVGSDGTTATVDSSQAATGLDFLVNGFKQGYIPKEALGFQETQSLNAFEAGQLMFMRNWPYADAILGRQGLQGHRQVRHRTAAGTRWPRRLQPRRSQRRHQHVLEVQGDRPRLPEVPGVGPDPAQRPHRGHAGAGADGALLAAGPGEEVPVPADAADRASRPRSRGRSRRTTRASPRPSRRTPTRPCRDR